jgi:uncharacterized membrane protein YsdA (DUF1294 family)
LRLIIYLGIVNVLTAVFFTADKYSSKRNGKRISESTLHLFEMFGGIFAVALLMPVIRHKNRKIKYWAVSIFILILWIIGLFVNFDIAEKLC